MIESGSSSASGEDSHWKTEKKRVNTKITIYFYISFVCSYGEWASSSLQQHSSLFPLSLVFFVLCFFANSRLEISRRRLLLGQHFWGRAVPNLFSRHMQSREEVLEEWEEAYFNYFRGKYCSKLQKLLHFSGVKPVKNDRLSMLPRKSPFRDLIFRMEKQWFTKCWCDKMFRAQFKNIL